MTETMTDIAVEEKKEKEWDFEEARRRLAKMKANRIAMPELTRGNKECIRLAIKSLPEKDRKNAAKIKSAVMDILTDKFGTSDETGDKFLGEGSDYQLSRAGMFTVGDVSDKVDYYLQKYA